MNRLIAHCPVYSLAYAEMYMAISTLITTFDLDFFDIVRERDIDYTSDRFIGETRADSPGVSVLLKKAGGEW